MSFASLRLSITHNIHYFAANEVVASFLLVLFVHIIIQIQSTLTMSNTKSATSKVVVDLSSIDSEEESDLKLASEDSSRFGALAQQQYQPSSQEQQQKKRSLQEGHDHKSDKKQHTSTSISTPIKLFATLQHLQNRHQHAEFSTQCRTLRELLGFDATPASSIDWLVLANYIVDFEFLLNEVPEFLSVPVVTAFFGTQETPGIFWKHAVVDPLAVDLVPMIPSDPPQSMTNPLSYRIPYGVHHSKIFLVGFTDRLRVVIHTANLRHCDIHLKSQASYSQDFPLKTNESSTTSTFEEDLASYFRTYQYDKQRTWQQGKPPQSLVDCLSSYDFSSAQVVLISSTPGYHNVSPSLPADLRGHLKLRGAIREHCRNVTETPSSPSNDELTSPIICQFSSMGSLSAPYLRQLQDSMDIASAQRPKDARPGNNYKNKPLALRLVYPTPEEVRTSVEGYRGGASVPGTVKNVTKAFLRPLYYRWGADAGVNESSSSSSSSLFMSQYVPHIKTFYQVRDANTSNASMEWFVVSSHNMSKAAWGEIQNTSRGRRLFVRHWELGVFLSPSLLQCERLVPWSEPAEEDASTATVPLPYAFDPRPYDPEDKPWAVDQRYAQADRFGRHSAYDM